MNEVRDIIIKDPVFIIGNPRTGSSLFHTLLSADPLTRCPLLWELRHPSSERKEVRVETATKYTNYIASRAPLFDAMHHMEPLEAGECTQVFN